MTNEPTELLPVTQEDYDGGIERLDKAVDRNAAIRECVAKLDELDIFSRDQARTAILALIEQEGNSHDR
jgi:hypothetical protein